MYMIQKLKFFKQINKNWATQKKKIIYFFFFSLLSHLNSYLKKKKDQNGQ